MSSKSSTEGAALGLPETVAVARFRSPHGVRGGVTVDVLSDVDGRLATGSELTLVGPDDARRRVKVTSSRPFKTGAIITLEGVSSREEALKLRGSILEIARSEVPPAEEGSYYRFELVGCSCCDSSCGEIGTVSDVLEDGGGLLLQVDSAEMSVLVPFVESFVTRVDVEARRIEFDLPDGLIEKCASRR